MKQVLTIAGFDSNGSAGMAADLHSFFADQVYGHGVLTAAVAENTKQITATQTMSAEFVQEQLAAAADFPISAVKTGMLANREIMQIVIKAYSANQWGPLVVDPVIVTKQGDRLVTDDTFETFCRQLLPLATVITPNFVEASELVGEVLSTPEALLDAAIKLQQLGAQNVVIKGKHPQPGTRPVISSLVRLADGQSFWINNPFIKTQKVNGAGDSFSAIITAELAKGRPVLQAIERANDFVVAAVQKPLGVGQQFGPLNHWAGQNWRQNDD